MQEENVFFSINEYSKMTDEEIIKEIRKGDKQALTYLMNKYKEIVNLKVGKYFMVGAEKEDIIQ